MAEKAGRPPALQEPITLTISIPKSLHDYLGALAKSSPLGTTETEVAAYLLKAAIDKMIDRRFHELEWPQGRDGVES